MGKKRINGDVAVPTLHGEYEVGRRVRNIEQQLKTLPLKWQEFAGAPMEMFFYDKKINTFRDNNLPPTTAYMSWALKQMQEVTDKNQWKISQEEMKEIIAQEWRTDMVRKVFEARLNRHGSKDGPVVRRSKNGSIYVAKQPEKGKRFILDGMVKSPQKLNSSRK